MADQTILNKGGGPASKPSPNGGLMEGVGSFGNDLATLASLQAKLAAADARESLMKALPAVIGLGVLVLLLIAGMGAIVAGLAVWLAEAFDLRLGVALMLVGLGCLILGALFSLLCLRLVGSSFTAFRRSSEELERNLAWVKTTLTRSGR